MIIYPSKLEKDNKIGITAPSDGANLETIEYSIDNIKNLDYDVIETNNVRTSQGIVSSDGRKRAYEFIKLWEDSKIGYIVSARGGEFLMEMIPFLDKYENNIKSRLPKWVQGYSDTSLLLYYLTTKYRISTIHFENLGGYSKNNNYCNNIIKNPIDLVEKIDDQFVYQQESFNKYELNEFDEVDDRIKIRI